MRSFSEYNSTPPEYKQADYGKSCLNCKYLDSQQNICRKYDASVSTNYVCLSWERGDPMNNLNEKTEYAGPYTYIENPTPSELFRFLNQSAEKELRFAISKDKKSFFIWDSDKAEHNIFRLMYHQRVKDETFTFNANKWYASTGMFIKSRENKGMINFHMYGDDGFHTMKKLMKSLRYDLSKFNEGEYYRDRGFILNESASSTEVETLRMNLVTKYTPSKFYLFMTNDGDLKLDMIAFNKDKQKQGRGSALMHDLVQWADKKNLRIILTTGVRDPHWGTTSASRLKKFYKRFGFVENKGRNKDFTISGNMYRNPT